MTGVLSRLIERFRPSPISDAAALAATVAAECAHISQKVPIDYVEARAHAFSAQLFTEKPFLDALHVCTRESYAAVLGDLLIVVEGTLRGQAGGRSAAVADRVGGFYAEIIHRLDPPVTRSEGWGEAIRDFNTRYTFARAATPRPAADVAIHGGERMFATLPLHRNFTRRDQDAIVATVQFRAGNFAAGLRQRLRPEPLIADLAGP